MGLGPRLLLGALALSLTLAGAPAAGTTLGRAASPDDSAGAPRERADAASFGVSASSADAAEAVRPAAPDAAAVTVRSAASDAPAVTVRLAAPDASATGSSRGTAGVGASRSPDDLARAPESRPASTGPGGGGAGWVSPVSGSRALGRRFELPAVPWGSGHRGVDLHVDVGSPVRSPGGGTVAFAGPVAGREVLVVAHPGGLRSTLEPVTPAVQVGAAVAPGTVVGALAATPGHCAPASCLHWGLLRGTVYLDPLQVLLQRVVLLPAR